MYMNQKRLAFALAIAVLVINALSALGFVAFAATFEDTKGHWAEKNIDLANEVKLVAGYPDGTFKPNKEISRSEFIALVVRISHPEIKPSTDYWARSFIDKALERNLIAPNQYGEDTDEVFNQTITRMEMVAILSALIQQYQLKTYKEPPVLNDIGDLNKGQSEQLDLVLKAGLMSGYGNGNFGPFNTSSRAEAATICLNIYNSLNTNKSDANQGEVPNAEGKNALLTGADTGFAIGDAFDASKSIKSFKVNANITYHLLDPIESGEFKLVAVDRSGNVVLTTRAAVPSGASTISYQTYMSHSSGDQRFLEYTDPGYRGNSEKPRTLFLFEISPLTERSYYALPTALDEKRAFEELSELLVNVFRLQRGVSLTATDRTALVAARDFSKQMVDLDFFDHDGPNGLSFYNRVKNSGVSFLEIAENIAFGLNAPADLVAAWVNSEGHRHNMEDPNFDHANIGIHIGPNGVVATQWLFKKK